MKIALRHTRELYGKTAAQDFGPLALVAIQNRLVDENHCRRYINQNIGRIKRMFKWATARELLPVQTYQRLLTVPGLRKGKTVARESKPVMPVDDVTVEKTLAVMRNQTTADMVRFQRLTGCRPGELFVMRPRDIDRTGGGHEGVWLYWPESHKMEHKDRHRVIVIGPKAQRILAKYALRPSDQHCFLRTDGKPYEGCNYCGQIQRACDRAFPAPKELKGNDLKAWRKSHRWAPNRLRHSTATEIRREHGLEAAQVVAGHAKADVTQIYAERDLAKAATIMAQVG